MGIVGKAAAPKLLEVSVQTSIARVRGFIGRPESARQRIREQFLFVNGRFFKSTFFHKAIIQAYEKLIPATVQPPYFLYLEVDPDGIDVNVHPQKTEVKFSDQSAVWQIINAAVKETLAKSGAVPMMDFDTADRLEIPVLDARTHTYHTPVREPAVVRTPDYNPFTDYKTSTASHTHERSEIDLSREISAQPEPRTLHEEPAGFSHITPLGEGYAVALFGTRFVAIDLRRAREAMLFERLEKMLQNGHSATQQLLFPERMALSADDAGLWKDHSEEFAALGFDIRSAGEHSIEIAGTPPDTPLETLDEVIYEMLDSLRDGTFSGETARRQRLAAVMAHAGASAAKTAKLTATELETLLKAFGDAGTPAYTPAGKRTMTEITIEEIKNKL